MIAALVRDAGRRAVRPSPIATGPATPRSAAAERRFARSGGGGLHPLYLGLDRHAEGRRPEPAERHRLRRVGGGRARAHRRRCRSAGRLGDVRPLGLRPVRGDARRRLLVPIHESTMMSPVTFCRAVAKAGRRSSIACRAWFSARRRDRRSAGRSSRRAGSATSSLPASRSTSRRSAACARFYLRCPSTIGTGRPRPMSAPSIASPMRDLAEDGPDPDRHAACPYARLRLRLGCGPAGDRASVPASFSSQATPCSRGYWNRPEETAAAIVRAEMASAIIGPATSFTATSAAISSSSAGATAR